MKGRPVHFYRWLALLSAQLFSFFLPAQDPACVRFNEVTGLNSSEVYDLLQDRAGFIWIATDRGVFRFDGYTFEPFTTAQGLTDNTVFCIQEDYVGRIWAMPFNGRLCYIENNRVVQYEYNDTLEKYLPGNRIARSIHVLPSGTIQIGYLTHGIVEVSTTGELKKITVHIPGARRQYSAIQTEQDDLLLGSLGYSINTTPYIFTFQSGSFTVAEPFMNKPRRENIKGIRRKSGSWCFAVSNDLIEIDVSGNVKHTALPYQPLSIYEDDQNCLWLGFDEGGGVRRYASGESCTAAHFEDFYSGEIVTGIIQDQEGAFWVSTLYNGLIYIPFVHARCWRLAEGEKDVVLGFMPYGLTDVFSLWRDHGVVRITGNQLSILPGMPYGEVTFRTLSWDAYTNELIIGCTNKTIAYNVASEKCTNFYWAGSNSIVVTKKGDYLGAAWNLRLWSHENRKDSNIVLGNPAIRIRPDVLYEDRKGQIWMGGLNGLYLVNDSVLVSCSGMHQLLKNRISGICELADSTLVVATQSNGIVLIRNGVAREVEHNDEYVFDHIGSITPDSGNAFWISARGGLYKATITGGSCTLRSFAGLNNIAGNGGACYYSAPAKTLWLANNNSIISFDPSLARTDLPGPPVFIRSVSINDSVLSLTSKPELEHQHNFLHIVFSGLAYRLKGDIRYRYRLAGQDSTWKYTKQHSVDLAGLQAGDYRFEVEAQGENGTWSNTPAVYAFFLRAPFWETGWFRVSALTCVLLLCWGAIALRYRILRKRDLLREQALIYRQEALASQMNPHFVFNAMNTIQSLVLKEDKTTALEMFASFASLLRKSLEHSGERFIALSEEIRTVQLNFRLEQMRYGEKLKCELHVTEKIQQEKIVVPAMLIQPMVENSIRHGIGLRESGGNICVRFLVQGDNLICEVEDDGIGRDTSSRSGRMERNKSGMKITQDRLLVLSQLEHSVYAFDVIDKKCPETNMSNGTLVRFNVPHLTNP